MTTAHEQAAPGRAQHDRWVPRVLDRPPFSAALTAEWNRLTAQPAAHWVPALTVLVAGGTGTALTAAAPAIRSVVTGGAPVALTPAELAVAGLPGAAVTTLLMAVWCAATTGAEHSDGLLRLTLLAVGRRGRVLAAAVLVRMTAASIVGVLGTLAAVGGGRLVAGFRGVPAPSLLDPALLRPAASAVLMAPFLAVVAVALGHLLRHTGAAVAAVLALVAAPWLVGAVPAGVAGWLPAWLPGSALQSLAGTAVPEVATGPPLAAAVLLAWLAALLGAAYLALTHRDA